MYQLEIQRILLKIEQNPLNEDFVIAHLKQAIAIADRNQNIEWAMDLRNEIIQTERSTSRCVESFSAFAWIMDICQRYPEEFNQADYLLAYQWMLCSAYSNSNMPLEKIFSLADDLQDRIEKCAHSKIGFYFTMSQFYHTIGDSAKSSSFLELAIKEDFDAEYNLVDQYDYQVENQAILGNFDRAIELCQEMEQLKLQAFCLPFATHCALAYYLARAKDTRAITYLNKAKQGFANHKALNSSMLYSMVRLLYTMYLLEDPLLWTTYQTISSWQINAEDDLQLLFFSHMASISQQTQTVKLELSSLLPFYSPTGLYHTKELHAYFHCQAQVLATAFDLRNNNQYATGKLSSLLADSK